MKHIDKRKPIPDFVDFVRNEHPGNWDDIHCSRQYPNLYRDCRDTILVDEQNGLGGYTERPLIDSADLHIDHYRKKGMNWPHDVTFDWNNFVVESRDSRYGACHKDKLTKDMADYDRLLNPMEDYPERMIAYFPNGKMYPCDGLDDICVDKVNFTIERFNLNHQLLKAERETLIKIITVSYAALSDDEVRQALADNGYPTVVEYALAARHAVL